MRLQFGISYQGSKTKIIPIIGHLFPKAKNFYDLFGGGFSVTHYMMQNMHRNFERFHFNEIRPGVCELIQKAIKGDYSYDKFKMPWVSRQEFFDRKETDSFIKIIWSFGNNGRGYLFGDEIELPKRSLHQAIIFNEFDSFAKEIIGFDKWPPGVPMKGRRLFVRNRVVYLKKIGKTTINIQLQQLQQLEQLEQLERLQHLEQLEQLLQLEQLQRLEQLHRLQYLEQLTFYSIDYRKVPIEPDSVIYCDIPYLGTVEYDKNKNFDHKEFFDWAAQIKQPVFISEYNISDSRFKLIKEINTRSTMAATGATKATERLYVNNAAAVRLNAT